MNMEKANSEKSILRRCTDKIYGGLSMSWPVVIIYAVITAIITTVFLVVPIFKDTSFEKMGATFEAWIFFAIIIMANCKSPIDSAVKTFVFFLVSQPLIYLFQVPFSDMGWQLFNYYGYWFKLTLLTFPMAFVGWFIKKKNWFSLLILLPAMGDLTLEGVGAFKKTLSAFPHLLVTAVFCLFQILLYLYVFTEIKAQKLFGLAVLIGLVVFVLFFHSQVDVNATVFLPDDPVLSENATVEVEDSEKAQITIDNADENGCLVCVHAKEYGSVKFTITDGDKQYHYTAKIFENENGGTQVDIIAD